MSSRADGRTAASQFVSLTLKLKDKLHPPRIRRPERAKQSPQHKADTHELQQGDSQCQVLGALAEQQRAVVSSLQYFKALVDRVGVDKLVLNQSVVGGLLGGASSGVLEAVQSLVQLEPHLQHSSCLSRLCQSVTQLIRWADQVILQGVVHHTEEEATPSVTTVIRAVLDGVKELVRLDAEGQESPSPQSPDQEQQSPGIAVVAPPKPPIPLLDHPPQTPPTPVHIPPALPPKKRQSASGPSPCRVAIVAPMRREPEANSHVEEKDECWKRCSATSADSVAINTLCIGNACIEDDPDYNFLHTDLSSADSLPPLPHCCLPPPALPEKRRSSTAATTNCDERSVSFGFDSAPQSDDPSYQCDVISLDESLHSPLSPSKTPPPLPEKKRAIHQYLQFCATYSGQSTAMFYPRPLTSSRQEEAETDTQLEPAPSPELPVLPPKKRQQDSVHTDRQSEDRDSSQSVLQESESDQRRKEKQEQSDQQEVLLLTELQEILHRITVKSEGEEGPDIKAGTSDILLVFAAEADSKSGQSLYREAFVATYRSFVSPTDVIVKLQHRFRHLSDGGRAQLRPPAGRTFDLLLTIVDELCAMELDSELLLLLTDMVYSLLIGGELSRAHALRSNILSKVEERWQLIGSPLSLRPLSARGVAARPGTLLDFRSHDLAEQLTLLDSELFYKIKLPEVLMWSKEQNEEKSLNLNQFTQHFNSVSFWVRSVIILQEKAQEREKLLQKFLKIMKHLRKLNNFNSYLSILSALDSAPLRRLDWQRNTAEILEEFSSLIDSSSSFRAYRAALAEVEPPCIPYLGLILQDLTFVHLGNPDSLVTPQGSKVNFSKQWQQFNILHTLQSYQQVRYSLQPDDEIISFFNDFSDHLAEEALWELSLRLRPRNVPRVIQR
ncbi:rap guanine nucleotide exchange factor 1 isoform X1 [Nelusetta ayraudi]|uniref:rap guanine nucleotide exchange factor 1 isoform X1 n=1 Tax=Nelusetta ayraudi TaxID=303726 RepID=UPI003F708A87